MVGTAGDELDWSGARLFYSPDGQWLLAAATLADGGPSLLDRESGHSYVLALTAARRYGTMPPDQAMSWSPGANLPLWPPSTST
jgi:hypothetical protein